MTQKALGDLVGVGMDSVSKHERGELGVSSETLVNYAKVFGVSVEWLAGDIQDTGAPRSAGQDSPPPRMAPSHLRDVSAVPMAVARLLNDGRCNPITDEEIAHLTRHLADGNSPDLTDLEIHLLAYRAERDRTDDSLRRFRAAVERVRKEKKMVRAGDSVAPSAATTTQPRPARKRELTP